MSDRLPAAFRTFDQPSSLLNILYCVGVVIPLVMFLEGVWSVSEPLLLWLSPAFSAGPGVAENPFLFADETSLNGLSMLRKADFCVKLLKGDSIPGLFTPSLECGTFSQLLCKLVRNQSAPSSLPFPSIALEPLFDTRVLAGLRAWTILTATSSSPDCSTSRSALLYRPLLDIVWKTDKPPARR
jgi:hypothetical protein